MPMTIPADLTTLSAYEAARFIAAGELSAAALVDALLSRISEREPDVRAWAFLDPVQARAAAKALDRSSSRGPLHGVPIGIKDVIATADQPTAYNSSIYRNYRPAADAKCVQRLRDAGAIILGKTVTTEFAFMRPGPTRHPYDLARTPGGSSSGSGAAVADRMVPVALGTQTGGSTIRPAAFCGVYGYKPAFGLYDSTGLKYLAPSLDTLGFMVRDLRDIPLVSGVLAGVAPPPEIPRMTPRFALFRPPFAAQAEPAMLRCLEDIVERAAAAGARVRELETPTWLSALDPAHRVIMAAETARSFAREWRDHRAELSTELAEFIARGSAHTEDEIAKAWSEVARARHWLFRAVGPGEIILTLSAAGEAPLGLTTTGTAIFNRLWTILYTSCLNVPIGRGANGLPIGCQLVDAWADERQLLAAARWLVGKLELGPEVSVA